MPSDLAKPGRCDRSVRHRGEPSGQLTAVNAVRGRTRS